MAKPNVYTADAIARITVEYEKSPTPETVVAIAASLGVTAPSVRSKLASLGVYRKAEPAAGKRGKENKEEMTERLRELSGLSLPNLEASGRVAIAELLAHFSRTE